MPTEFRSRITSYLPVIAAMLFWSFSFIWYKQVFVYYGPVTLIVFRLTLAIPFLFLISLSFKRLQKIEKGHLRYFLGLALFEPFLYFIGECYGVNRISPTLASIIISLIPLVAPIPAWYIFRERFTFTNFIGLFISMAGVVMVIAGEQNGNNALSGVLLMFLAVISAVCHSVFVRKLTDKYNTFTIVTYQSTLGLLYFLPLFYFLGFREFISMKHTFTMVLPVIKLAIFASSFAFLLFVYSIQHLGMARTNVFVNLIPVFTAVLSFIILKESFTGLKVAGIVIVIAGLIFSQLNRQVRMLAKTKRT
ncbi:MAG TPA: DMT family transporter [Bacteroidales bacterium]|nr:DMT family transporter [Bacteroidales bacterium]